MDSNMNLISSFQVNHLKLLPGLYVSQKYKQADCDITVFDIRLTAPNKEPVVDMPALHTIEHLAATYLRNSSVKNDILFFCPMGCRTGCYLGMFGNLTSEDIVDLILDMCTFIINYNDEIPGAKAKQCGNYLEHNLKMAKYYIQRYRDTLDKNRRFIYPQ